MKATNNNLAILSEAEQAALYEIPDFDGGQRLNYLNLTSEEQALTRSRSNLSIKVYCEPELVISNECGRFIANAIIHYNSSILSKLKEKYTAEGNEKALAILRKIFPAAWRHIHFQGHFIFSDDKIMIWMQ